MKQKIVYFLCGLVFLAACSKDNEPLKDLSKDEAKKAFEGLANDVMGDFADLMNAEGYKAIEDILWAMDMETPDILDYGRNLKTGKIKEKGFKELASDAKKLTFLSKIKEDRESLFDFESEKGIYDVIDGELQKTGDSDKIVINVLEASAVITIHSYKEVAYNDHDYDLYLPTLVKADIYAHGKKQVEVDFSASLTEGNEKVELRVYINPFTLTFGARNRGNESLGLSFKIEDSSVIFDVDLSFNFKTDILVGDLSDISGYVAYRGLKVQGSLQEVYGAGEYYIVPDLKIYSNNRKLGDVVLVSDKLYIKYNDGSMELVEEVLGPLFLYSM